MEKRVSLESADRQKLRKHLMAIAVFPIIVIALFVGFIAFFFNQGFGQDRVGLYMMFGFFIFFFAIIFYLIWSVAIDLKRGVKISVKGRVTDKRLHKNTTSSRSGTGSRARTRTKTQKSYHVYINDREYAVDYPHYSMARLGNEVILEKAPKSGVILGFKTIGQYENDTLHSSETQKPAFIERRMLPSRYSKRDYEALQRIWKATIKKRMFKAAPFLFFSLWLFISGFWGFVVLLFPLWLVPLYQAIKLFIDFKKYQNNKLDGRKIAVAAEIVDKFTLTSNTSSNSHVLSTTAGRLSVQFAQYEQGNIGDSIIVNKTLYGNVVLSFVVDKEEFYVV